MTRTNWWSVGIVAGALAAGCGPGPKHDSPPPGPNAGGLVAAFGTGGVLAVNQIAIRDDAVVAILTDGTNLYLVGYEEFVGTGDYRWRIEKRLASDGSLVSGFGSSGVYVSDPSTGNDQPEAAVHDGTHLYVVGYDSFPGPKQWRVEKIQMAAGTLDTGFNTTGIFTTDPSAIYDDEAEAVVHDGTNLYVGGYAYPTVGDWNWRVQKIAMSNGALVTGFPTTSVYSSNPSSRDDEAQHLVQDGTHLYVVGYDESPAPSDWRWRIEKITLAGAVPDTNFNTTGIVTSDPSTRRDWPLGATIAGGTLFVAGFDEGPAAGATQWRVEAYNAGTGAPVSGFGSAGVVTVDPLSGAGLEFCSCFSDGNHLYVGGLDLSRGVTDGQWRLERRSLTSGVSDNGFGYGGTFTSNPSLRSEQPYDLLVTASHFYSAGNDQSPATGDYQWRVEKRTR